MRAKLKFNTLKGKSIALVLITTSLCIVVSALIVSRVVQVQARRGYDAEKKTVVESLSCSLAPMLELRNYKQVERAVVTYLRYEEIATIAVFDASGALIKSASAGDVSTESLDVEKHDITSNGKVVGSFEIGFSREYIKQRARTAAETLFFGLTGLFALLGLALYVFMKRLVVEPLESFTETVKGIGPANLAVRVRVHSGDEIGILAESFNSMIENLEQAQQALSRSERKYRLLAETARDMIIAHDMTGRITYINPAGLELTGYRAEEALGKRVVDLIPPERLPEMKARQAQCLAGNLQRCLCETELVNRDGQRIPVEISSAPIVHEGQIEGVLVIARDTTKRQQAEATLSRRAHELGSLAQVSAALRTARTIDEMLPILVREAAQAVGALVGGIFLEEPESGDFVARCWYPSTPPLLGRRHRPGDGITGHVAVTGEVYIAQDLMRDPLARILPEEAERFKDVGSTMTLPLRSQGRTIGVMHFGLPKGQTFTEEKVRLLTSLADIAANAVRRATLHEQTQLQAQQMQQIMRTVPEGVLLLDADKRIVHANPVARNYLSVLIGAEVESRPEAGEVGERPFLGQVLTHLGNRPLTELLTSPPRGLWHEVVAGGQTFDVIARPVEDGPRAEGWALVIRDVTKEREVQQRIQQQERLAAVGQLAAGIAHDFNNILAVIVLYAQMDVKTPDLPPRTRKHLETIAQQADLASKLIRQILDFSRRAVLERRSMNLVPFLKEQVKVLERTLPENIKLRLDYDANEYTVNADPTRLQQVIMNLAVNARDAMPAGGELHIDLQRVRVGDDIKAPLPHMRSGEWVRMTISDTGMGIPPEALPHIFEPFFTTKAFDKGTGLGLAQVYGIIKQHEGEIDVASKVGHGTAFTIYLPILPTVKPELQAEVPKISSKGHDETILVVEDNQATRGALIDSLELLGYRVLEAVDGRDALAVLEQHQEVALVLSDVVMPEMGGIALFHTLRQQGPMVPVVLITGHPMKDELEKLRLQGLSGWLSKPLGLERLAQLVGQALKGSRQ